MKKIRFNKINSNFQQKLKELVFEFDKNNKQSTFGPDFKFYSLLIESKASDDYDDFVDEYNKAAQKYENKVSILIYSVTKIWSKYWFNNFFWNNHNALHLKIKNINYDKKANNWCN